MCIAHSNYNKVRSLLQESYKITTRRRTTTKIGRSAVHTYAGDQEWLNARGKKSLRSARWNTDCGLYNYNCVEYRRSPMNSCMDTESALCD